MRKELEINNYIDINRKIRDNKVFKCWFFKEIGKINKIKNIIKY